MTPPFLSAHSSTLTIFIILLSLCTSNGESDKHKICSSSLMSCANLKNVGYPFWGAKRPQYCGHPALMFDCRYFEGRNYPVLIIGSSEEVRYVVLGIDDSSPNITIQLQSYSVSVCPFNNSNKAFDKIFQLNRSVVNITLFNNCYEEETSDRIYKKCWGNHIPRIYPNKTLNNERSQVCNPVEVPVLKKELQSLLLYGNGTLPASGILMKGFEVDYLNSSACSECKRSNGTCGSNDTEFACFYPTSDHWKLIVGLAVAATVTCILIVLVFFIIRRWSTRKFSILWKPGGKKYQNIDAFLKVYGSLAPKRYTYAMARKITNNFSEKLGEGGYAIVYKGKLSDGRVVAVKLLKQSKGTGEDFINEVASISRTNHVNIVALLGFCFEGNKRALIYEFMSNGSLEKFAYHGAREHALPLEVLYKIGVGIATGLDYLHRGCNARILHFDIKPHNILLDDEFHPKISDFGLARLCPQQESSISTMETARGTVGYIAPEVFCRTFGGVSHKSDVYSYGMMMLDIICGRKNIASIEMQHDSENSEMYFPQWIYKRLELGEEVADHGIMSDEEVTLERKMVLVSLWCIQTYPSNRPSMTKVIEMLQGGIESLQMPPVPNLSSPPISAYNSSGYPFWGGSRPGTSNRPRYCGHPALEVECQTFAGNEYAILPFLEHKGVYYQVLGVNNTSPTITIKLRGYTNGSCMSHAPNKVFYKIFEFSEGVENITLYADCHGEGIKDVPDRFKACWANNSETYYPDKTLSPNLFHSCNRLKVPVVKEEENRLQSEETFTVSDILLWGFKVDYLNSSACSRCKNSGGTCGSDHTKFACFHPTAGHRKFVVGLGLMVGLFLILITIIGILIGLLFYLKKRRSGLKFSVFWKAEGKKYQNIDVFLRTYGSLAPKRYTYAMIQKFTSGFNEKLGEGGFAVVYKGKLCDGRLVAVKLLKQSKGTGEDFINEVASISRTNHVNIVALLGFCFEGSKRALIYEFMSNGSLEKFAYHGAREQALPWETLLNIGLGIATGLDYLHRGCTTRILHFDIKPHNILLDEEFQPKISDFGLARLCPQQESTISLFEAARGTVGYIAPEVFCRTFGGVSHKSDVYSYGMMILDIVCGRKNIIPVEMQSSSEMFFPQWIFKRLQQGEEVANHHGIKNYEEKTIERKMILVSLWCIQTYPSNRPSMTKVIEMLQGGLESLLMPPESLPSSPPSSAFESLETISVAE